MKSALNNYRFWRQLRHRFKGSWLTEGLLMAVILMAVGTLFAMRITQLEMNALSRPYHTMDQWKATNIALELQHLDRLAQEAIEQPSEDNYDEVGVRLEVLTSLLHPATRDAPSGSLIHSLPEAHAILEKIRKQIDQWSAGFNDDTAGQVSRDIHRNIHSLSEDLSDAVIAIHIASSIERDRIRISQYERLGLFGWTLVALLIGISALVIKLILDRRASKRLSRHLEHLNKRLESRVIQRTRQLAESKELLHFILDASPSESALVTADSGDVLFMNKTLLDRMGLSAAPDTLQLRSLLIDQAQADNFLNELEQYGRVDNWQTQLMPDKPYWSSISLKLVEVEGKLAYLLWGFDVTEHRKLLHMLETQANTDAMTQLYNRRAFYQLGEQLIDSCKRYSHTCSLLMLDIDHFKRINDTYGHATGDRAISTLSEILRSNTREADIIGRLGGEEFAILLPHTDQQQAEDSAERLRIAVANHPLASEAGPLNMTLSIGLAVFNPSENDTLEQMMVAADKALYRAKQSGRNRVEI